MKGASADDTTGEFLSDLLTRIRIARIIFKLKEINSELEEIEKIQNDSVTNYIGVMRYLKQVDFVETMEDD